MSARPSIFEEVDKQTETTQAVEESSTLEASVQAKLDVLKEQKQDDQDQDDTVDDASKETDDGVTEKDDVVEKEDDSSKSEEDTESTDESILPVGYRRAALGKGWTNEEIDHFVEIKPDEARAEFKVIFDERSAENARWSARGQELVKAGASTTDQGTDDETSDTLSAIDAQKLIDEHGNEELVNAIVGPVNKVIATVNDAVTQLRQSRDFIQESEESVLNSAVETFFSSDEMKSSRSVYGTEIKTLSKEQNAKRMEVYKQADIIVAGASDHGIQLSVSDALTRAHAIVSHDSRDTTIRQEIRDSMKKRTKTEKSSHRKTRSSSDSEPVSEKELESRVQANMQRIRDK